jgi:hypothetical protein
MLNAEQRTCHKWRAQGPRRPQLDEPDEFRCVGVHVGFPWTPRDYRSCEFGLYVEFRNRGRLANLITPLVLKIASQYVCSAPEPRNPCLDLAESNIISPTQTIRNRGRPYYRLGDDDQRPLPLRPPPGPLSRPPPALHRSRLCRGVRQSCFDRFDRPRGDVGDLRRLEVSRGRRMDGSQG